LKFSIFLIGSKLRLFYIINANEIAIVINENIEIIDKFLALK